MFSRPFRILSLDGGGLIGAFSASVLATMERATGQKIVEHFDLIAAFRQEADALLDEPRLRELGRKADR